MFLEFIVWLILFSFFAGAVLTVYYWQALFRSQYEYTRDELLDIPSILLRQFDRLTGRGEPVFNYAALALGIGLAWLLVHLGGFFSPNNTLAPDHAESEMPNYFFHSALFPAILHIIWPSLRDVAYDQGGPEGLPARLLRAELPFFFALATALAALNLTIWGVHHEMNFLFCLVNALLLLGYAGFRIHTRDTGKDPADAEDDYYADDPYAPDPYAEDRYAEGEPYGENPYPDDEADRPRASKGKGGDDPDRASRRRSGEPELDDPEY